MPGKINNIIVYNMVILLVTIYYISLKVVTFSYLLPNEPPIRVLKGNYFFCDDTHLPILFEAFLPF